MATLRFRAEDVRRVVEHALAATDWGRKLTGFDAASGKCTYAKVTEPSVYLVHDEGVYLMSAAVNGDMIEGTAEPGKGRRYCAYAEGCNPDTDRDWWDTARALVGGDDFGETLPWAKAIKARLDSGVKIVTVKLSANRIALG
jgi:hypothetical protein